METAARPLVETISIASLRRDGALVVRGMLLLMILPGGIALTAAMQRLGAAAEPDMSRLLHWQVLVPFAVFILTMLIFRRFMGRLDRRALETMRAGYAVTALALLAAAAWAWATLLPPIPWHEFELNAKAAASIAMAIAALALPVAFILWYAILNPLRAAGRLLRATQPDGRPITAALDGIRGETALRPDVSPARRAARAALLALACIAGVAMILIVVREFARGEMVRALVIEFALLAAIIGLTRLAHRFASVDAATLLASDHRRPILYLRSFQDDVGKLEGEWGAVVSLPDAAADSAPARAVAAALDVKPVRMVGSIGVPRLEEVIAAEVAPLGPFVAIGAPNEPLPQLGAARAYYDNDTWQTAITRWIDLAQLIVKVAGPTKWIRWELGHIIDQGALPRLVALLPPIDAVPDRAARWHNMAQCFAGTPWEPALASLDPAEVMALRFKPDGGIQAIVGSLGRPLDVVLALRLLLDGMRRDGVVGASPASAPPSTSPSSRAAS